MELGNLINNFADSVSANRGFATILDNPFYTAILMTFVIVLIFYLSGARKKGTSRVRVAFYIFSSLLIIMFIYHRRFRKCSSEQARVSDIRSALANPLPVATAEQVQVIPPIYMTAPN
jgi:hypothetical protein